MSTRILSLEAIDKSQIPLVGGKAANLGELSRIAGVRVPAGFVVTTAAFARIIQSAPAFIPLFAQLEQLSIEDREGIGDCCRKIRSMIEGADIPFDLREEIARKVGNTDAYAVRSSATAEDLPTASFAGQQDSFLNVVGRGEVLLCIAKCWASLYTDRAVIYRMQNGFDHRKVSIAVIVQKMADARASGVLFTADPTTGNRHVSTIEAGLGLGEALVSGHVNPDGYNVRDGVIVAKRIPELRTAARTAPAGQPILTDEQILRLERLGRKIEEHFGCPQDIEWCLADDLFDVVQSRPVTTLYPIPEVRDRRNHVYVSVGHQQMMTEAMRPLGISVWLLTAARLMDVAGSRLFVDVTDELASPVKRDMIINVLGKNDPLIKDALLAVLDRGDFIPLLPSDENVLTRGPVSSKEPASSDGSASSKEPPSSGGPRNFNTLRDFEPSVVSELINQREGDLRKLKKEIQTKSGDDLFAFLLEDIQRFKTILADPQSFAVIMTAMNAAHWINDKMQEWLGETGVADTLSQSVPHNVTSEMGLALLDVADVIRPYPDVVSYLQTTKGGDLLAGLTGLEGGREALRAIDNFLDRYGMRCAGEIDITRTRWSEDPAALVPMILTNIRNSSFGAGRRKFEEGLQAASAKEQGLLARLRRLPDGDQKANETQRMIGLLRNFAGYREYPKYSIVCRYFVYKQALLREAARLVDDGVLVDLEDSYYLRFDELREVVRTRKADLRLIAARKETYLADKRLTPPRVITSEGEVITGKYNRGNIPSNALKGLAVSSGIVEGRARVVLTMEDAFLEAGDVLVTAFTDPSWTPLFVSIKGLITEVGGLMTHGAVIAREYGLPAVVGVEGATRLIKDGQLIRVNGTEGWVEILGPPPTSGLYDRCK